MQCPKCHATMDTVVHQGFQAHRCQQCQGMWFAMGEAEHLKEAAEAIDTGDASQGERCNQVDRIQCPTCVGHRDLVRMVDARQPHIWYESCKYCYGRFYDAGEFRDFAEYDFSDWLKDRKVSARF